MAAVSSFGPAILSPLQSHIFFEKLRGVAVVEGREKAKRERENGRDN